MKCISTNEGNYNVDSVDGAYEYLAEVLAKKGISSDVFGLLSFLYREAIKNHRVDEAIKEISNLPRHDPFSSANYGTGYMCPQREGNWLGREEVMEILEKYRK
jgi:hypothetical protein